MRAARKLNRARDRAHGTLAVLAAWIVCSLLTITVASAQPCPPSGCGADWRIPTHFTLPNSTVQQGQMTEISLRLEAYQPIYEMHLRFEVDPDVAEFVGALPGRDLHLIGSGGSWYLEDRAWVHTANESPEHPGWQLNYLRISNWGLPDLCHIDDRLWGSLGGFLDLGIRTSFEIARIFIQGNAPGQTPLWVDRVCNGEPTGGTGISTRDSFVSFAPWGACPNDGTGSVHIASGCVSDPAPYKLVTLSTTDWQPFPAKPLSSADPMITVERPTAVVSETWARVKRLYR